MREGAAAPRTSRELAVRNQFFTPRYVVDFLVQNTLGRRLIENDPTSPLMGELTLLPNTPAAPGPPLDLHEVAVLDPACGSGHFLLGCYDLLERAWELKGVRPSESAPAIVASLWGVDIDPRCAQVASAAIVLRARRHCRELPLPRPNIVTARNLPVDSVALSADLGLSGQQRQLVDRISGVLSDAPMLGVLLKAEEAVEREIRHAAFDKQPGTLPLTDRAFAVTHADLMNHLQAAADRAASSVADRLLAAEMDDALRLVDVVQRRYDVVLMNPPFGEAVPTTREYLKGAYGSAARELAACFVARAQELLKPHGRTGVLATRQVLFLDGLEVWRREQLLGSSRLETLVDLGIGVLQGALVEVAAFIVSKNPGIHAAAFIRLLDARDKAAELRASIPGSIDLVSLDRFSAVGKAAIPYWIGEDALLALSGGGWSSVGIEARTGPQTDDDFRLLRLRWELPEASSRGTRWIPISKGGEYEPYWGDIHLLLDWDHWEKRPRSRSSFLRGGLTYPYRTTSDHCLRLLPSGCGFTRGGPAIQGSEEPLLLTLASCFTRPYKVLVEAVIGGGDSSVGGGAARNYSAPWLSRMPPLSPEGAESPPLIRLVREALATSTALSSCEEESALFVSPIPGGVDGVRSVDEVVARRRKAFVACVRARLSLSVLAEDHYCSPAGLTRELCDALWGRHPEALTDEPPDLEQLGKLWELDEPELVEAATQQLGAIRFTTKKAYFADRRLELAARILGCRASRIADEVEGLPPTRRERAVVGSSLVSYLVGAAFGRFDLEAGRADASIVLSRQPFDALPAVPPGVAMASGRRQEFAAPRDGVLVDEEGHERDIARVVRRAEQAYFSEGGIVADALAATGDTELRTYLRRRFFKEHLSRYSKSRRKAPIYWPLTVPSRSWGVWIYAPTLSRETLYAVASEADRRERLAVEAIARLEREEPEDGGRPARKIAEELDSEEKLAEELRRFRTEAQRIAALGWEPDLDDGIVLCAAPLAEIFSAWPDAKKARDELRKGHHEWAAVARWAEEL